MENSNEELKVNQQIEETSVNSNAKSKKSRLNYYPSKPLLVEAIYEEDMNNLFEQIDKHLEYNENCRARGRVAAGKHRAI